MKGKGRGRGRTPHVGCHGKRSPYSAWGRGGKRPCASGTYRTREAGTRSLYVTVTLLRLRGVRVSSGGHQRESRRCDVHRRPWQHSEQRPRKQLSSRLRRSRQSAHAARHTSPQSAITRSKPNPGWYASYARIRGDDGKGGGAAGGGETVAIVLARRARRSLAGMLLAAVALAAANAARHGGVKQADQKARALADTPASTRTRTPYPYPYPCAS